MDFSESVAFFFGEVAEFGGFAEVLLVEALPGGHCAEELLAEFAGGLGTVTLVGDFALFDVRTQTGDAVLLGVGGREEVGFLAFGLDAAAAGAVFLLHVLTGLELEGLVGVVKGEIL